MENSYKENSLNRWFVSGCISILLIILSLYVLVQKPEKSIPDIGPLMELDYVVIEPKPIVKQKEIPKVQPRKKKAEPVKENVQEEIVDIPETPAIPLETSDIPEPDINSAPEKQEPAILETSTPTVRRIEATEELDNTDFEPIYNPRPDYPAVAQAAQISGYVDIDLLINEKGRVESYTIVKTQGHPLFAIETAKVLPRWRFPPPRIGGIKVSIKYLYRVRFTLN